MDKVKVEQQETRMESVPAGVEFDRAMPFGYAVRHGHIFLREYRPVCTTCGRALVLRDGRFRCARHSLLEVRAPQATRVLREVI